MYILSELKFPSFAQEGDRNFKIYDVAPTLAYPVKNIVDQKTVPSSKKSVAIYTDWK